MGYCGTLALLVAPPKTSRMGSDKRPGPGFPRCHRDRKEWHPPRNAVVQERRVSAARSFSKGIRDSRIPWWDRCRYSFSVSRGTLGARKENGNAFVSAEYSKIRAVGFTSFSRKTNVRGTGGNWITISVAAAWRRRLPVSEIRTGHRPQPPSCRSRVFGGNEGLGSWESD